MTRAKAVGGGPRPELIATEPDRPDQPEEEHRHPDDHAPVLADVVAYHRIRLGRTEWAETAEPLDGENLDLLGRRLQGVVTETLLLAGRGLESDL